MEDSSVSAIYRSVIDTVIERVKPDFVQEGVDESVLDELRIQWEKKLKEIGAMEPEPVPEPPRKQQQAPRQMPPLPAFLSNLQQPAPAQPYGAHTNTNSALAGSPAQYLTSRPYQGSAAAPQYPAVSGRPLGMPAAAVHLPSDRLHPHLLSSTVPGGHQGLQQQQQHHHQSTQPSRYAYPVTTAQPQQQAQRSMPSSAAASQTPVHQHQPQGSQQGYQQLGGQAGVPQAQQQQQSVQQQNGTQQGQASLSMQRSAVHPGLETRKRKAQDDDSDLFSLLPTPAPASSGIPQQDGPGDDDEDAGAKAEEDADDEAVKGETFSDVSSEPDEEDDQQIANILVGQYEKVTRSRSKWKVHLKEGVMRLNGKDHLFRTALGDMQFS
ncbi:hypothetical protein CVIRNUC_002643 [Coccomyxa viridis]|uniref:Uncharacterized protein n=1 Tax=Coccomyxa viridis TaxID=1274662 RepID=A0AAV1HYZ9_9CHLO|nr:hypothetical protein CVIRNUC_002643 [Coccomyxa viridis]